MANERDLIVGDRPVERELRTLAEGIMQQTPGTAKLLEAGILEVARSGVGQMAPDVGDLAELFELPDVHGKIAKLADLLARGLVVLMWYQGGWSSYCNVGLQSVSSIEPQIRALGATLVVVSPELPEAAAETINANRLNFIVLSDKGNVVARRYNIVFKLPQKTLATMRSIGVDVAKANGDDSDEIPLPVTYVIDPDRTIRWAFVDADYRKRAEPSDILKALTAW
jgi:peroxiredoxin